MYIYLHQKWSLLSGYSKLLIFYNLEFVSTLVVSLAAMMEDIYGQCRRHTYFPDSISKMA